MSTIRERKPEEKKNIDCPEILVKTCIDPVAAKTYEDLKVLITEKYPNQKFTFKHELYPIPIWKDILSRACNAIFALFVLILVAIIVIPKTPYAYLISPEFLALFRAKKFYIAGAVILLNYVAENIQKTGAFEIYYNGELVSSKLQDGDYPDEETIFNFINKKL